MESIDREIRGLPLWLMQSYLEQVGGQMKNDGWLHGDGWRARLTQLDDFHLGSLSVGQIRVEWEGDANARETVWPQVEKKLIRAGG